MRIAYYLLILPLSKLPLGVLYGLSNVLYWILYRMGGYRKDVVMGNLRRSFPEKGEAEINAIASDFYRHFCDLVVEGIRLFSMPAQEIKARFVVTNPEVLDEIHAAGRSALLVAGHYGNWEIAALSLGLYVQHPTVAIFSPIKNAFFNELMLKSRGRHGMILVPKQQTGAFLEANHATPYVYIFGADQSPTSSNRSFWMEFLNQDTAIAFGVEKFSTEFNIPVVFGDMARVGRGRFTITLSVVSMEPASEPHGHITRTHVQLLEQNIRRDPRYWLWTHKRWKRKREA